MDVLGIDTFLDELETVAFPKVDVPLLCLRIACVGIALGEFLHGETGLGKEVVYFVAHFEAVGANAGPDDGMEMGWLCAEGGAEHVDVAFDDAFEGTFPSSVHCGDYVGGVVPQEDGNAVSGAHTDADVVETGGECVNTVEGQRLLERVHAEEVFVDDDGLGFMHLVQRHEELGHGNGNTAISRGGEGSDM